MGACGSARRGPGVSVTTGSPEEAQVAVVALFARRATQLPFCAVFHFCFTVVLELTLAEKNQSYLMHDVRVVGVTILRSAISASATRQLAAPRLVVRRYSSRAPGRDAARPRARCARSASSRLKSAAASCIRPRLRRDVGAAQQRRGTAARSPRRGRRRGAWPDPRRTGPCWAKFRRAHALQNGLRATKYAWLIPSLDHPCAKPSAERQAEDVAERSVEPELAATPGLELRGGRVVERAAVVEEDEPVMRVRKNGQRRDAVLEVPDREAVLAVEEARSSCPTSVTGA